jgi:hypothetical protein
MTATTSPSSADPATPGSPNTPPKRTRKAGYVTRGSEHHDNCPPGLGKPNPSDCYTCRILDDAYHVGYQDGRDDALIEGIYELIVLRDKELPMPNA